MKHRIEQPLVRKALLLALLLPMLALAVWTPAPADASGGGGSNNCTYSSDDTYTTVVGKVGYDCCNNWISWGRETEYAVCDSGCFICYPPPIE